MQANRKLKSITPIPTSCFCHCEQSTMSLYMHLPDHLAIIYTCSVEICSLERRKTGAPAILGPFSRKSKGAGAPVPTHMVCLHSHLRKERRKKSAYGSRSFRLVEITRDPKPVCEFVWWYQQHSCISHRFVNFLLSSW